MSIGVINAAIIAGNRGEHPLERRDYMQMPSGGRDVVIHDVHREREMAD